MNFLTELLTNSSMNIRCFLAKKIYKLIYHCCGIISLCKFIDPSVADWVLNSEGKNKNINYLVSKHLVLFNNLLSSFFFLYNRFRLQNIIQLLMIIMKIVINLKIIVNLWKMNQQKKLYLFGI